MPRDDLTPPPRRNALLAPTELTLADVLTRIESDQALTSVRRRDWASAIRRVCALTAREPAMLSASIPKLHRCLAGLSPSSTGLSAKTLANLKANLLGALRAHGGGQPTNMHRKHLRPEWRALAERLRSKRLSNGLSRFVRYCSASGTAPADVSDATVTHFKAAVRDGTFARKPSDIHRRTCKLWNEASATIPGWPEQRLSVPSYRKKRWTTPLAAFPVAFRRDVDAYLAWLQDPLADPPPPRTCRPQTIINLRSLIERAASCLVLAGKPLASFQGLADLTSHSSAKVICRRYLDRFGGKPGTTIRLLMVYLVQIAQRWTKVEPAELDKLKRLRQQMGSPPPGMTEKNRAMLLLFEDPDCLERLLLLPGALMSEAMRQPPSPKAAVKAQIALGIEILLNAPVRGRNLIGLRLDRHLVRVGKTMTIVLPAEETKTAEPLEYPLPADLVRMIELYLARFRPLLGRGASPYLFPSMEGDQKHQATLAIHIQRTLQTRAGITMTSHQFRHLCAKLYLDANPGAYAAVQHVLGHTSIKTTMNFYAGMNTARAARVYDEVIANRRQQLADRAGSGFRPRRRRSGSGHA